LHSWEAASLPEFEQELVRRNKESILLQYLPDDHDRVRPHDVHHHAGTEFRQIMVQKDYENPEGAFSAHDNSIPALQRRGLPHLIAFLLHHFWLLYPAVILFSSAELIAGAALMAGLLTRLAALVSGGLSKTPYA
jgi:hypothetical protein